MLHRIPHSDATTKEKMICIRCHPNYRGQGYPWKNWALIQFELSTGVKKDFPCHVLPCIPRQSNNGTTFDLIVQSCHEYSGRELFLFTELSFRNEFNVVSATALVILCVVLCRSSDLNAGRNGSCTSMKLQRKNMTTWKTKLKPDFLLLFCRNFATYFGFLVADCIVTRISIN